ncbi:Peptidoglycan-recognition protein 1, partial [Zootermopsis nevadensis]
IPVSTGEDDCPRIISRSGWGARPSKHVEYMKIPVEYAIIHHTVTPKCNSMAECVEKVSSIHSFHVNTNGWDDIGFSFLVGGDGNVYEGRGWHQVGAHTYGFNKKSVGIALIGEFSDSLPPRVQLDALKRLLKCGVKEGELAEHYKLLGGRQISATKSPGLALYQEIQTWPDWVENP